MTQTTRLASFGPVLVVSTFFSFLISCISQIKTYICKKKCQLVKKKRRKKEKKHTNDPNNVSRVVWACFSCLNILFFFHFAYIVDQDLYMQKKCQLVKKKQRKKEKKIPMTQTMRLASFGPVFIACMLFSVLVLCISQIETYICNKMLVRNKKSEERKKNILVMQNAPSRALPSSPPALCCSQPSSSSLCSSFLSQLSSFLSPRVLDMGVGRLEESSYVTVTILTIQ